MSATKWQAIEEARKILQLGDQASFSEIKGAYRRLSKLHHPDTACASASDQNNSEQMRQITAAYQLLVAYCNEYRFPLKYSVKSTQEADIYDPEEWWHAQFGQDLMWHGNMRRKRSR